MSNENIKEENRISIPYGRKDDKFCVATTDINKLNIGCKGSTDISTIGYVNWVTSVLSEQVLGLPGGVDYLYMHTDNKYDAQMSLEDMKLQQENYTIISDIEKIKHTLSILAEVEVPNRIQAIESNGVYNNLQYNKCCKISMESIFIIIDNLDAVMREKDGVAAYASTSEAVKTILESSNITGIHIIAGIAKDTIPSEYTNLFNFFLDIGKEKSIFSSRENDCFIVTDNIDTSQFIKRKVRTPIRGKTVLMNDTVELQVKVPIMKNDDNDVLNLEIDKNNSSALIEVDSQEDNQLIFETINNYRQLYICNSRVDYIDDIHTAATNKSIEKFIAEADARKKIVTGNEVYTLENVFLLIAYIRVHNIDDKTIEILTKALEVVKDCKMHLIISATAEVIQKIPYSVLDEFSQYFQIDSDIEK